jgi:predicted ribosomally synthesized peptide with SipW-like signal peptide
MSSDSNDGRSGRKKLLATVAVIGAAASLIAVGAFSAFSATTTNPGNTFSAGTVDIEDNDSGNALYQVTNQAPGNVTESCITVTYTGSLDSSVKLYGGSPLAAYAGGQFVDLKIEQGTQTTPPATPGDCSDFSADAGAALYDGTVRGFRQAHSNWGNGLATDPQSGAPWVTSDIAVYRFSVELQDVPAAEGVNVAAHDYTWEAQNN